jgi:hypothetical protein
MRRVPPERFLAAGDLKLAVVIAWLCLTALTLPAVLAPFFLADDTILDWTPVCERRAKYGEECALCGMTRSFLLIWRGNFGEASERNRAGLPLFFGMAGNQLAAVWLVARRLGRGRNSSRARAEEMPG